MTEQWFEPVGYCIYCGKQTGAFTDEHVVPFSLGGNIVLPQASCSDCQKHINSFEAHIATETYLSFRSAQRYPSRTKNLLTHVSVEFKVGSTIVERVVPFDDAPVPVVIPSFGLPPYLFGTPTPAQLSVLPIDAQRWERTFSYCREAQTASIASGGIKIEHFVRLVMKIAYGFAWLVDPKCAFKWNGRTSILDGKFPDFPIFSDIYSVPSVHERGEFFRITLFTNENNFGTELFCQLEILTNPKVPTYICRLGTTELKHPFGIEFRADRDVRDIGGMQLRLPPTSHLK